MHHSVGLYSYHSAQNQSVLGTMQISNNWNVFIQLSCFVNQQNSTISSFPHFHIASVHTAHCHHKHILLFIKNCVLNKNTSLVFFFRLHSLVVFSHSALFALIRSHHFDDYYQNHIHVFCCCVHKYEFKRLNWHKKKFLNHALQCSFKILYCHKGQKKTASQKSID